MLKNTWPIEFSSFIVLWKVTISNWVFQNLTVIEKKSSIYLKKKRTIQELQFVIEFCTAIYSRSVLSFSHCRTCMIPSIIYVAQQVVQSIWLLWDHLIKDDFSKSHMIKAKWPNFRKYFSYSVDMIYSSW